MNTTTLPASVAEASGPVTAHVHAEHDSAAPSDAIRERGPEWAVSGLLLAMGALVVFDSLRLGSGWADDGPQSGYFPFYIGLMLMASSGFVLFKSVWQGLNQRSAAASDAARDAANPVFVEREQLKLVMAMLVPASLYVASISFVGLYLSSFALILYFMRRHGQFGWAACSSVAVGVPLTVFMVFERWFLVPLPKGPIEQMLGF